LMVDSILCNVRGSYGCIFNPFLTGIGVTGRFLNVD
jgi:hypothetical protein